MLKSIRKIFPLVFSVTLLSGVPLLSDAKGGNNWRSDGYYSGGELHLNIGASYDSTTYDSYSSSRNETSSGYQNSNYDSADRDRNSNSDRSSSDREVAPVRRDIHGVSIPVKPVEKTVAPVRRDIHGVSIPAKPMEKTVAPVPANQEASAERAALRVLNAKAVPTVAACQKYLTQLDKAIAYAQTKQARGFGSYKQEEALYKSQKVALNARIAELNAPKKTTAQINQEASAERAALRVLNAKVVPTVAACQKYLAQLDKAITYAQTKQARGDSYYAKEETLYKSQKVALHAQIAELNAPKPPVKPVVPTPVVQPVLKPVAPKPIVPFTSLSPSRINEITSRIEALAKEKTPVDRHETVITQAKSCKIADYQRELWEECVGTPQEIIEDALVDYLAEKIVENVVKPPMKQLIDTVTRGEMVRCIQKKKAEYERRCVGKYPPLRPSS